MYMEKKVRIITVGTLAALGVFCISSGFMYSSLLDNNTNETVLVVVQQRQISNDEPDIEPKNLEIEVNTPLSIKIIDYLNSAVSDEVLANLTLDTSNVNVTVPGTYQYVITYKDKSYEGTIVVKEPETTTPTQTITLKSFNIKIGTTLSNDISAYVTETLTDDIKAQMILDISKVNPLIAGTYQYTITYNNSIYTGTITVIEDQPTLDNNNNSTPGTEPAGTPTEEDQNNATTTGETTEQITTTIQ